MDHQAEKKEIRYRLTRQAALVGAVTNLLLSIVKTIFGILGQSQSLLADGIHSLSDLLSDGLVMFAARHAQDARGAYLQKVLHRHAKDDPDAEHPYGHGRYETAATMGLGIFLILVGMGIIWDAVERLFSPDELLQPHTYTLYIALFSIVANEGLYFYTQHIARRIKSELIRRAMCWV